MYFCFLVLASCVIISLMCVSVFSARFLSLKYIFEMSLGSCILWLLFPSNLSKTPRLHYCVAHRRTSLWKVWLPILFILELNTSCIQFCIWIEIFLFITFYFNKKVYLKCLNVFKGISAMPTSIISWSPDPHVVYYGETVKLQCTFQALVPGVLVMFFLRRVLKQRSNRESKTTFVREKSFTPYPFVLLLRVLYSLKFIHSWIKTCEL